VHECVWRIWQRSLKSVICRCTLWIITQYASWRYVAQDWHGALRMESEALLASKVYVCACICLYIYIYIYIYLSLSLSLYIYIYIYTYMYIHIYIYIYIHLYVYVYVYTYIHTCIDRYISIYLGLTPSIYLYLYGTCSVCFWYSQQLGRALYVLIRSRPWISI